MFNEELKQLASEFGLLLEDVGRDVGDQIERARKLDEIDTTVFGLETDDGKIVKVFVNVNDAEKFEKIMADCLGETESIEEAINKAAAEVDIVDVEWPEESEEAEDVDDGSDALDPKVYADDNDNTTKAKKETSSIAAEGLTYKEQKMLSLMEDHGSVTSRMTTPTQQLVLQAVLDLGIPEIALDRSPYRALIIKGMKQVAQELQGNGGAKMALKTFIKQNIDDDKHKHDHEPKEVKEASLPVNTVTVSANGAIEDETPPSTAVTMSEAEGGGMLLGQAGLMIELNSEELERAMKAVQERATTVIGKATISPRGSTIVLKLRGDSRRMTLSGAEVGKFKELASKLIS